MPVNTEPPDLPPAAYALINSTIISKPTTQLALDGLRSGAKPVGMNDRDKPLEKMLSYMQLNEQNLKKTGKDQHKIAPQFYTDWMAVHMRILRQNNQDSTFDPDQVARMNSAANEGYDMGLQQRSGKLFEQFARKITQWNTQNKLAALNGFAVATLISNLPNKTIIALEEAAILLNIKPSEFIKQYIPLMTEAYENISELRDFSRGDLHDMLKKHGFNWDRVQNTWVQKEAK